ncbi:MAG TPA: HAD family hydrolase [Bryobacteraceae bacterium]|nr:HAD family hydrolase [Bryobacteraceae bacterium]
MSEGSSAAEVSGLRSHAGANQTSCQLWFPWHEPETAHTHIVDGDGWWSQLTPLFVNTFRAVLGCDEDEARSLSALVRPAYVDLRGWSVFDDTFKCLEGLRCEGWRHVILSNHVPELPAIVDGLGLTAYIDRIFNSAETSYEKPHRQAFHQVIEYCGAAWMIGDNPVADVRGAQAAGMNALLVGADNRSLQDVLRLFKG